MAGKGQKRGGKKRPVRSWKRANDIARLFYEQGLGDHWLSQKQTAWLYDQAQRESDRALRAANGSKAANGSFTTTSGEKMHWSIQVSPRNGCAVLTMINVSEQLREKERLQLQEAEQQAAQARREQEVFVETISASQIELWLTESGS